VTETTGLFAGAFNFGSPKYLTPGSAWLASSPAAFTFELAAYPVQTTTPVTPLSLGTSTNYVTELYQNRTSWAFLINPTLVQSSNSVTVNSWNGVVGTWDGSKMRLYLNGSLIAGPTNQSTYPGGVTTNAIGALLGSTASAYFQGSVCEVRISTIARSAGWIATEYNSAYGAYYGTFYTLGSTVTY
jgi:hypothetical protein